MKLLSWKEYNRLKRTRAFFPYSIILRPSTLAGAKGIIHGPGNRAERRVFATVMGVVEHIPPFPSYSTVPSKLERG